MKHSAIFKNTGLNCLVQYLIFLLLALLPGIAKAEDYAGEAYLTGYSVSANGTSGNIPSLLNSPSNAISFPAYMGNITGYSLELATLPTFDGLSDIFSLYGMFPLDSNTEIGGGAIFSPTDKIYKLDELEGTREQRMTSPDFRPEPCSGNCQELKNMVYLGYLNVKRRFNTFFPRIDYSSSLMPLQITVGTNIKYLKDELWGENYISQNVNLDAGVNLRLTAASEHSTRTPLRTFIFDLSGFELLQTSQTSNIAKEQITSRYHIGLYWIENILKLNCSFKAGITQQSEWGKYPGFGLEWSYRNLLFFRSGFLSEYISGGASIKYRFLAIHYSLRYHDLALTPYQISLQLEKPCCFF